MYYEIGDGSGHLKAGFKHSPFQALVAPRPIGWISTLSKEGVPNLAPYSYFNAISSNPPAIMFCSYGDHRDGGEKDSLRNARETGEFVFNLCTEELGERMNVSSTPAPRGTDEFEVAGLTKAPSKLVKAPRVAESPVHMECQVIHIMRIPLSEDSKNHIVMGRVLSVHIRDDLISNGRVDTIKARPMSRLGYFDYAVVTESLEMMRPDWPLGDKGDKGGKG